MRQELEAHRYSQAVNKCIRKFLNYPSVGYLVVFTRIEWKWISVSVSVLFDALQGRLRWTFG